MSIVYMIRHGKPASSWGEGDEDPGLDETGQAQARAIAEVLLALPEVSRPTKVVSSPIRRCRETAAPFAAALGVEVEIDPRVGEVPTPSTIPVEDRPAWLREAFQGLWSEMKGDLDYEAWRRDVAAAVAGHAGAAVFSHFVAINAAMSVATDEPRVMAFRPDHTSLITFETDGKRLILKEAGREAATQVL